MKLSLARSPHNRRYNTAAAAAAATQRDLIPQLCRQRRYKEAMDLLCSQNLPLEALHLLDRIPNPPAVVYSTLVQFCLKRTDLSLGNAVHDRMRKSGFVPGVVISNRLIDMYVKCGSVDRAREVFNDMRERDACSWNTMISGYVRTGRIGFARELFDQMTERDNFSWTAMVSGYVRHGQPLEAIKLFRIMQASCKDLLNKYMLSASLAAVAAVMDIRCGREIHGRIVRMGLESDEVVWSALSDVYGKCGSLGEARHVFDRTVEKDVVSWTAMIDRYFGDGRREEGFALFRKMVNTNVRPNEFTFSGVLNACADHAAEELGKQVHAHLIRVECSPQHFSASALVHMYSKCGNMEFAREVFERIQKPDLVAWTSMITGFARNGLSSEAIRFYEFMLESGIQPDHVTFVGILSACVHAGLVDKGLEYFHSIDKVHGLAYTADHYACIVDLLARSGRFNEAEEIINKMPMKPDRFLWASLLGGCRIHRNMLLAKKAAEALFEIEPENPTTYITLANMYAISHMWDEVSKIRKMMESRGVVKKPGLSWVEIGRKVHVFAVGDTSHPKMNEMHDFLAEVSKKMKEEGYLPDTNFVLHDIEEEQKEQNLIYHSEKLAAAYGILSTSPGIPLKIFKNLRTCVDCHNTFKFISKMVQRKIVVRDSNRFHSFEDGICSCRDYW
ncbi:hypothetical protein MLD38_018696 [Melastoma candidum]|uniref:Uncharacterized protein n=1 Tax=Melastoma candidum TaxID=119954 RepID=A0ACB9QUJ1_9MYRT|nr:hypothetical protein MLD38_018696 [Melastoma candidum]